MRCGFGVYFHPAHWVFGGYRHGCSVGILYRVRVIHCPVVGSLYRKCRLRWIRRPSFARLDPSASLSSLRKNSVCACFWVAQRFTPSITDLFSASALAAAVTPRREKHFFRNLLGQAREGARPHTNRLAESTAC